MDMKTTVTFPSGTVFIVLAVVVIGIFLASIPLSKTPMKMEFRTPNFSILFCKGDFLKSDEKIREN